jgi:hypothetical protein
VSKVAHRTEPGLKQQHFYCAKVGIRLVRIESEGASDPVSDDEQDARLLTTAARQLAAYLATPALPQRVELLCLAAAAQLPRSAGTDVLAARPGDAVDPDVVLRTLSQLSRERRATGPALEAVAHLNAAGDALRVP